MAEIAIGAPKRRVLASPEIEGLALCITERVNPTRGLHIVVLFKTVTRKCSPEKEYDISLDQNTNQLAWSVKLRWV